MGAAIGGLAWRHGGGREASLSISDTRVPPSQLPVRVTPAEAAQLKTLRLRSCHLNEKPFLYTSMATQSWRSLSQEGVREPVRVL